MDRQIIHLDMDAFFAAVETLDNPEFAGRPVIVGGDSGRGVVSAASYEARKHGVHSALPMAVARKRCPAGIFRPPRMSRYQEVSAGIMAIFEQYTPLVEQISVDEAFLDVTGCANLFGPAEEIAATIRCRVKKETGLTVSAGLANSKLVAKIASDQNKPDGLTVVPPGQEEAFLAPLPAQRLWGVGQKTLAALGLLGIRTIGDLTTLSLEFLEKKFGQQGCHMYYCARGIDERPVAPSREIKSIGNEETFSQDLVALAILKKALLALATKVGERLRYQNFQGRTITLKIRYHDFETRSHATTLPQPTDDAWQLYRAALRLFSATRAGVKPVRLLGLSVARLTLTTTPRQLDLFSSKTKDNRRELNRALDRINQRYGPATIQPALLTGRVKRG